MTNPKILVDQIVVPGVLSWGLAADRPTATGTGIYYYETDTPGLFQDQGSWVAVGGGSGSSIPLLYADPLSPYDGQLWLYREILPGIPDGTPIGLLLGLTYTGNAGIAEPLKLSVNDAGVIRRIDFH